VFYPGQGGLTATGGTKKQRKFRITFELASYAAINFVAYIDHLMLTKKLNLESYNGLGV
jgi:hypothetical protein